MSLPPTLGWKRASVASVREAARGPGRPSTVAVVVRRSEVTSSNHCQCVLPARVDGVGEPLALALHPLPPGDLAIARGIEGGVANIDRTRSLVMADDQAMWRDARPSQLERVRRRAVGEQLFAA